MLWEDLADLASGPLATGSGHSDIVSSVAFSRDGSRIVSGSLDNTVLLWDTADLASGPLATGSGHSSSVESVAFSPDGSRIVSGSWERGDLPSAW
jgi:WD40 repeat protein